MASLLAEKYPGKFADVLPEPYVSRSFNIEDGQLFSIDREGRSASLFDDQSRLSAIDVGYKVFLVHGTMYDTRSAGFFNPHRTIYEVMRGKFRADTSVIGVGWRSVPFTVANLIAAWKSGNWGWYGLAATRAVETAKAFGTLLSMINGPYAVVCHSIGCELALRAIQSLPNPPQHLLMMSPDVDYQAVYDWAKDRPVKVMHVVAKDDGVLKYSRYAARNRHFQAPDAQEHYLITVVDPDNEATGRRRFSFDYGNPRRYWDHMASFELESYWPVYLDFLESAN